MTKAGFADKISFRNGYHFFSKNSIAISTPPPPPPVLYSWLEIIQGYMIYYSTLPTTAGDQYRTYKMDYIDNIYMISYRTLLISLLDIVQYPVFNQTFATYMETVGLSTVPYGTVNNSPSESYTGISEGITLTS